jgi:proline iminopeptidase
MPLVTLADERPVILYDQLGSGNSTRTDRPDLWTVERFVAEIDVLRRALGLTQVIVLGHSWGGALAAEYAVRNPPGLRGVILSSPLISTRQWMADTARLLDELPRHARDEIRRHVAMRDYSAPAFREAEKTFDQRHACRGTPCPGEKYRLDGPQGNDAIYEYMWGPTEFDASGTLRNYDISARLHQIQAPALMICGEFDEATPPSCRKYAAMIASAPVVIIPGASHMSMVENEFSYLAAVRKFLRDAGL